MEGMQPPKPATQKGENRMKTLEQIKRGAWFISRPACIKQAFLAWPGNQLYLLKSTGQTVSIHSYSERPKGKCTTCKVIVMKGYNKGFLVFGIPLADLEPVTKKEKTT